MGNALQGPRARSVLPFCIPRDIPNHSGTLEIVRPLGMIETEVRKALRCTEPLAVLGPAPRGDCQAGRLLSSLACRRPPRPGEDTVSAPTVDRCPFLPLPEEGPAPRDLPTGVPAGLVPAPHGLRPEATRGHKEHVLFCSRAVMAQSPLVCRSQVCTTVTPEAQERTAPDLVHRQVVRNTSEPRAAGETVSGRCWWPSSTGSGRCVSQESKCSAARPAGPAAVSQARGSSRPSASGQNQWFAPWDGCPREEKGCDGGAPGAAPDLWGFWV